MTSTRFQWVVLALLFFIPIFFFQLGNEFGLKVITKIIIYSILVISLDLLVGYCGLVSLGHSAYFGIGAFSAILLINNSFTNDLIAISILSVGAALIVGAVFITLAVRASNFNFLMITLAFCQMFYYTAISLRSLGGEDGIKLKSPTQILGLPVHDSLTMYIVSAFCLMVYIVVVLRVVNSNFGMIINAFAHNPRKAGSLGYSSSFFISSIFLISVVGAALAGVLYSVQARYVSPDLFAWTKSAEILIMLVLGGAGNIFGGILGVATFIILEEVLTTSTEHWQLYLGLLLLVTVIFSNDGLVGFLKRIWIRRDA